MLCDLGEYILKVIATAVMIFPYLKFLPFDSLNINFRAENAAGHKRSDDS